MSFDVLLAKDAELAREALPDFLHMTGAGHGQPKPTFGSHGQPAVFVIAETPISVTLTVGHGRQHQPIGKR